MHEKFEGLCSPSEMEQDQLDMVEEGVVDGQGRPPLDGGIFDGGFGDK